MIANRLHVKDILAFLLEQARGAEAQCRAIKVYIYWMKLSYSGSVSLTLQTK